MDGETLQQRLSAYLDGEVTGPDREKLEAALRADPSLRRQMDELAAVKGLLGRLPNVPAPAASIAALKTALQAPADAPSVADPRSSGAFLQALLTQPEELVNAYFDRELSAEHRRHVETQLLIQTEHRQLLNDVGQMASGLAALPIVPAPSAVLAQVMSIIGAPAANAAGGDLEAPDRAADRSPPTSPNRAGRPRKRRVAAWLLSAYLDDELTDNERRLVERKLARSPRWRRWLRHQKKLRRLLAGLPRLSADANCLEPLLDRVAGKAPASAQSKGPPNGVAPVPARELAPVELRHDSVVWAFRATSALALAASVVLFIGFVQLFSHYGRMKQPREIDVVGQPAPAAESTAPALATSGSKLAAPPLDVFGSLHAGRYGRSRIAVAPEEAGAGGPKHDFVEPVVLSLEDVKRMRPGDVVTTLDGKQLNFVCVDVKRVFDHLRIVLKRNQISLVDSVPAGAGREDSPLYVVDISATPDQVRGMLADLPHEEEGHALISQVDVGDLDEYLLTSMRKAAAPAKAPDHPLVEEIRPPNELARWFRDSTAWGMRLPTERPTGTIRRPITKAATNTAGASAPAKAFEKADRSKPSADAKSAIAKTNAAKAAPFKPLDPAKSNQQIRVLLVLEPGISEAPARP